MRLPQDHDGMTAAETMSMKQHCSEASDSGSVRYVIKVAIRVGNSIVRCRWDNLVSESKSRSDDLHRAACRESLARHALD